MDELSAPMFEDTFGVEFKNQFEDEFENNCGNEVVNIFCEFELKNECENRAGNDLVKAPENEFGIEFEMSLEQEVRNNQVEHGHQFEEQSVFEFEEKYEHDDGKRCENEFCICVPTTNLIFEPLPPIVPSTILPHVLVPEPPPTNLELKEVSEINENESITFMVLHLTDVKTLFEQLWHIVEEENITIAKTLWPNHSFENSQGAFFLNDICEFIPSALHSFIDFQWINFKKRKK